MNKNKIVKPIAKQVINSVIQAPIIEESEDKQENISIEENLFQNDIQLPKTVEIILHNFTKVFMPLVESQIGLLRAMIKTLIINNPLVILKTQIINASKTHKDNHFCIFLTPDQMKMLDYCQHSKTDLELFFNCHQIKEIAKENFQIEIDIDQHVLRHCQIAKQSSRKK